MADQPAKQQPKKAAPFPANWARMSAAEKRAWQDEQRRKQGIEVKPAQPVPASPKQPAPKQQEQNEESYEDQENYGDKSDETQLEECNDEVQVTIKMPGQDVRTMTGREFVRRLLGGLYDAFGGATGEN